MVFYFQLCEDPPQLLYFDNKSESEKLDGSPRGIIHLKKGGHFEVQKSGTKVLIKLTAKDGGIIDSEKREGSDPDMTKGHHKQFVLKGRTLKIARMGKEK